MIFILSLKEVKIKYAYLQNITQKKFDNFLTF